MENSLPANNTGIAPKEYLNLSLFHAPNQLPEVVELERIKEDKEYPDFSISGRVQKIPNTFGVPENCFLTKNIHVKNSLVKQGIPYHWYYDPANNKWLGLLVEKKYRDKFSDALSLQFFSEEKLTYEKAREKNRKACTNKKLKMHYRSSGKFA
jgi:hypothetical protein